jgi:hypothetical protein
MALDTKADFFCPHCDAGNKVVRVKAEIRRDLPANSLRGLPADRFSEPMAMTC